MSIILNFQDKCRALESYYRRQGTTLPEQWGVTGSTIRKYVYGACPSPEIRKRILARSDGLITEEDFLTLIQNSSDTSAYRSKVTEARERRFVWDGQDFDDSVPLGKIESKRLFESPLKLHAEELKQAAIDNKISLASQWGVTRMTVHQWLKGTSLPVIQRIPFIVERSWGVLKLEEFDYMKAESTPKLVNENPLPTSLEDLF